MIEDNPVLPKYIFSEKRDGKLKFFNSLFTTKGFTQTGLIIRYSNNKTVGVHRNFHKIKKDFIALQKSTESSLSATKKVVYGIRRDKFKSDTNLGGSAIPKQSTFF